MIKVQPSCLIALFSILATNACIDASYDEFDSSLENLSNLPYKVPPLNEDFSSEMTIQRGPSHGILLIDRTGSMTQVRSTGLMRCQEALALGRTSVDDFFNDQNGTHLAIWTFANTSTTQRGTGYYTDASSAKAAIDELSVTGCNGSTPLADALCSAVDGLPGNAAQLDPLPGTLMIHTDGYENRSRGPCSAPAGPINAPGTWQNNVFNKLFFAGIRLDPRYFTNPTHLENIPGKTDPETGKEHEIISTESTCGSIGDCESEFFDTSAFWLYGVYSLVYDHDTQYSCAYGECPAPTPHPY